MADSILKLRVQSEEYDNKLKRASEAIQRYAEKCREAGGTLEHLDDGVLEFTRALGGMETVSKSAKGSIGELTKTFTDLSVQYNKLTDEEKNAPFGKALKSSLDELKGRIQSGNAEIKNIKDSLNGSGGLSGALDAIAGKFGVSTEMLTKFGGGLAVATTALKVAKDAFLQSESNIDEWGRTLKGAEGAYDIFLQTLNNGNWSNFFSNLSQAITGARDLYDAFDRLNSIKANNAVAIATTQAEIQQLRLLKQQGQDVDDKIKAATARLKTLQSQSTNAGINAGKSQVVNTLRNGVNSIGGAPINNATLNRVADNMAKQGQAYFDYMKRRAADLEKKGMVTKTQTINDSQGGTYQRQYKEFDINALTKEQQKQYAIAKVVTERETALQKGLTVWSQAVNEQASNAREQFRDNRYALQGSSGGNTRTTTPKAEEIYPEGSVKDLTKHMQELKKAQDLVTSPDDWREYQKQIDEITIKIGQMTGKIGSLKIGDIQKTGLGSLVSNETFKSDSKKTGGMKLTLDDKAMKSVMQGVQKSLPKALTTEQKIDGMRDLVGGVNGVLSGIEQMGIEIPNEIKQVMGVLNGIFTIVGSIESIVVTGAVLGLFSRGGVVPHAANGFAGTVPGNHFSGDVTPIMANAGEVVLNRAQAGVLAASFENQGGGGGGYTPSHVSGEQIWIALNAYTRRTGKGELVTWR